MLISQLRGKLEGMLRSLDYREREPCVQPADPVFSSTTCLRVVLPTLMLWVQTQLKILMESVPGLGK
jgi:hypothetical protein